MTRKKTLAATLLLLCLLIIPTVAYVLMVSGTPNGDDDSGNEIPTDLDGIEGGSMFVVPEIPIGTLGLISASIAALGLFALKNKRKEQQ